MNTYAKGKAKGDGYRWSEDRSSAWRLTDGKEEGAMDLEGANAALAAFEQACEEKLAVELAAAEKEAAKKAAAAEKAAAKAAKKR